MFLVCSQLFCDEPSQIVAGSIDAARLRLVAKPRSTLAFDRQGR
jgi:hypothetical protein